MNPIVGPLSAAFLVYATTIGPMEPQLEVKDYPRQTELYEKDTSSNLEIRISVIQIIQRLNTLQKFASEIIDNSIDLEPEIIEMVDRNFWVLL